MATRSVHARLTHYLCKFGEASPIFLINGFGEYGKFGEYHKWQVFLQIPVWQLPWNIIFGKLESCDLETLYLYIVDLETKTFFLSLWCLVVENNFSIQCDIDTILADGRVGIGNLMPQETDVILTIGDPMPSVPDAILTIELYWESG